MIEMIEWLLSAMYHTAWVAGAWAIVFLLWFMVYEFMTEYINGKK